MPAVDLLRQFDHADRRPPQGTFEVKEHTLAGTRRATLVVPADSRITWTVFVPHRAHLEAYVAFPSDASGAVAVRVGVSDNRIYNTISETTVATTDGGGKQWIPISADLSLYAGRKWSLFYRPDETKWRIILATHVLSGAIPSVYLGSLALVTDTAGAREYLRRLQEGRP